MTKMVFIFKLTICILFFKLTTKGCTSDVVCLLIRLIR